MYHTLDPVGNKVSTLISTSFFVFIYRPTELHTDTHTYIYISWMYFGISFWVSCLSSSLVPSFLQSLFGYYITYWFLPHSRFFIFLSLSLFACNRKYDLMYCFSQSIHQHTSNWFWQGHVMLSALCRAAVLGLISRIHRTGLHPELSERWHDHVLGALLGTLGLKW